MRPNPCTETSCYLANTDFSGGDLLPEAKKFRTANASACCEACLHYKVDKFCEAWSYRSPGPGIKDPGRCYLKSGAALAHLHRSQGMTAGYPTGIAPPVSPDPWYSNTTTVTITIDSGVHGSIDVSPATLRMINSTCANPKQMWSSEMKSVTWPSEAQMAALKVASQLCEEEVAVITDAVSGARSITVSMEAYAAAELVVPTTAQ